jgi:hypothetical protein
MKLTKNTATSQTPKGVRLHWQPLKEVKPVVLSSSMTTGKFVCERELQNRNNNSESLNILVP